jgi:hypothetical protein
MMMTRMTFMVFLLLAALQVPASTWAAPVLPQYSPHKSMGVGSCASSLCHGAVDKSTNSRILQNEYVIWSRNDKHARAYAVLLNARSKEIVRKLGLSEPAHRADLCLDCHAHNVPASLTALPANRAMVQRSSGCAATLSGMRVMETIWQKACIRLLIMWRGHDSASAAISALRTSWLPTS